MEKREHLEKMDLLSVKQEELIKQQKAIHQLDEKAEYQEKKDKRLYEEIAYMFKGDRNVQRLCSAYQNMSYMADKKKRRDMEEYNQSVRREYETIEKEESRIRVELMEMEEK